MKTFSKLLLSLVALALAARAEVNDGEGLVAQIATNRGTIAVILEYEKAPKTVANFITLAEGTRTRIDPTTGKLTRQPLYNGQTFYSVVNEFNFPPLPSTIYALTGSGSTDSNGEPGFTIPDEFDPSLRHTGYALSMATVANFTGQFFGSEINRGPNSGGSQIMITGNSTHTRFDDINAVFGRIADAASRAVVDALIFGGAGTTTITNVTIQRTGQPAIDFDEHAQGLPTVGLPQGQFRIESGATYFDHDEPLERGSILSFSRSGDLSTWSPEVNRHISSALAPEASTQLDSIGADKAFYNLFLARNPGGLSPANLANRTLVISTSGSNVITYTFAFDATGLGGTANYSVDGSDGTITSVTYVPDGYGAAFEITTSNIPTPLRARLGFDTEDETQIIGRHFLEGFNDPFWSPIGRGVATLTK